MKKFSPGKNILTPILAILLVFCMTPMPAQGAGAEDTWIKIGLYHDSTAPDSIRIESADGFLLMRDSDGRLSQIRSLTAYTALDVSRSGTGVVLRDPQGVLISNDLSADSVLLGGSEDLENRVVLIGGSACRDGVRFLPDPSGGLTVINHVKLEHYLQGVLSREMSPSYPLEALKAQAVTARSFALANPDRHSAHGFDLCAGTCCQVYTGIDAEYPRTDLACLETRGEVLSFEDAAVAGYYFAYSGGYTQNSEDVWSSALGYLRAVPDAFSPDYIWTESLTFAGIREKLKTAGRDPGTILSVRVGRRLANDSVAELIVEGSQQTVTLAKESIRTILGSQSIRSTRFSMGSSEAPPLQTGSDTSELWLQSAAGTGQMPHILSVQTAEGVIDNVIPSTMVIFNGTQAVEASSLAGAGIGFTDETVTGGTVHFKGMGYGHGVGMPQASAKEMADQGYGYQEILKYYYTDIQIRQANEFLE